MNPNQAIQKNEKTLSTEEGIKILNEFDQKVAQKRGYFIGYPMNAQIELTPFFKWWSSSIASHSPLNDVGDPFEDLPNMINARPFEREVLAIFAKLLKLPEDNYWGYITSGGTLGNEQGLMMGRNRLRAYGTPILYFSEDSHFSVQSLARLLSLEYRLIPSLENGEIDYTKLEQQLDLTRPALISVTIGTTFKGAIDNVEKIVKILKEKNIAHYHIHADAALFGGYLPYLGDSSSIVDLSQVPIDTIAISGHKFFGTPLPMGIFLTRKDELKELSKDFIEYIDAENITIPCSRNTFNTLLFWWIMRTKSFQSWQRDAHQLIDNATYLVIELKKRGIPVWINPNSNIVFFRAPSEEVCKKWSLAQVHCKDLGHLAHIVVMQHVTTSVINEFLRDLN